MPIHTQPGARRRGAQLPAPVPDWSKLTRGDVVRVFRRDGTSTQGHIDMLALDRSVFWIIQEGGRGRVMICSADRPRIVAVSQG